MSPTTNTGADLSAREFSTSRLLPASAGVVFQAFSNPKVLARWWGPKGFTNTFETFEFKPGGTWRFVMHGPDGQDYANLSVFEEVSPQRIVIRHLETVHAFTLVITLDAVNNGTRLWWRQVFDTAEEAEKVRPYVPRCNEEVLDRLEAEVAKISEK